MPSVCGKPLSRIGFESGLVFEKHVFSKGGNTTGRECVGLQRPWILAIKEHPYYRAGFRLQTAAEYSDYRRSKECSLGEVDVAV